MKFCFEFFILENLENFLEKKKNTANQKYFFYAKISKIYCLTIFKLFNATF